MASHAAQLDPPRGPTDASRPWLTVAEVALLLALCPRTVRRLIRSGQLAAVSTSSVRGRLRISREALAAFLVSATVKTTPAANTEVGQA